MGDEYEREKQRRREANKEKEYLAQRNRYSNWRPGQSREQVDSAKQVDSTAPLPAGQSPAEPARAQPASSAQSSRTSSDVGQPAPSMRRNRKDTVFISSRSGLRSSSFRRVVRGRPGGGQTVRHPGKPSGGAQLLRECVFGKSVSVSHLRPQELCTSTHVDAKDLKHVSFGWQDTAAIRATFQQLFAEDWAPDLLIHLANAKSCPWVDNVEETSSLIDYLAGETLRRCVSLRPPQFQHHELGQGAERAPLRGPNRGAGPAGAVDGAPVPGRGQAGGGLAGDARAGDEAAGAQHRIRQVSRPTVRP